MTPPAGHTRAELVAARGTPAYLITYHSAAYRLAPSREDSSFMGCAGSTPVIAAGTGEPHDVLRLRRRRHGDKCTHRVLIEGHQ